MSQLLGMFIFIKQRLSEPSTHVAIASLLAMTGHNVDPGVIQSSLDIGAMVFGVMGFFVAEAKPKTAV